MASNLGPGVFRIFSHTEGNPPISVDLTKPPLQFVHVNGPVQNWVFRKVGDGRYRLSIGPYPFTGVVEDKVVASINPEHDLEWEITCRERQETHTIAIADKPHLGWTVSPSGDSHQQIEIKVIKETRSLPPQFLPIQLFEFKQFEH